MSSLTGHTEHYTQQFGFNYGWVCPKCGIVYSPSTIECYKCNPTNKTLTSTDVAIKDYEQYLQNCRDSQPEFLRKDDNNE